MLTNRHEREVKDILTEDSPKEKKRKTIPKKGWRRWKKEGRSTKFEKYQFTCKRKGTGGLL